MKSGKKNNKHHKKARQKVRQMLSSLLEQQEELCDEPPEPDTLTASEQAELRSRWPRCKASWRTTRTGRRTRMQAAKDANREIELPQKRPQWKPASQARPTALM